MAETHIKLAAKLYECRDAARMLFKEEYFTKIIYYKDLIHLYEKQNNVDTIPAVITMCKSLKGNDNGFMIMMLMAAAVEIIEPKA